jgi:hypothetical protein
MTFVGLLLPVLAPRKNHRAGRRLFWAGMLIASVSAFFIAYPADWKSGIGLSLFAAGLMLLTAYFTSPYIKIGGKIFAFYTADAQVDASAQGKDISGASAPRGLASDSDGGFTTAKKLWWLMVPAMALCAFNISQYVVDNANPRLAALMALAIVAVAVVFGYGDGSSEHSIARGQRPQLIIVSIVTLGVFTVLYLGGYLAGKHQMLRRNRSMEHRAHPRYWKNEP